MTDRPQDFSQDTIGEDPTGLVHPISPDSYSDATIGEELTYHGQSGLLLMGRYRLKHELGKGGMGVVWLAEDTALSEDPAHPEWRAIKILPEQLATDPRAIGNLKREAMLTARLNHPGIVHLYNFEEDAATQISFLLMEYVAGLTDKSGRPVTYTVRGEARAVSNLHQLLALRRCLPEPEVRRLGAAVLEALGYAHDYRGDGVSGGIVHRDIKPSNILLDAQGRPKLSDFGIARTIQTSMTHLTGRASSGTLTHMAPEQLLGQQGDHRLDLYAMGIMLYEMLIGRPPFLVGDITRMHMEVPVPRVEDASDSMNRIIQWATAKRADDRPADAQQLRRALLDEEVPPKTILATGSKSRSGANQKSSKAWWSFWGLAQLTILLACTVGLAWWGYNSSKSVDTPGTMVLDAENSAIALADPTPNPTPEPTTTSTPALTPEPTPAALANARPSVVFWEVPPAKLSWGEGQEFKIKFEGRDTDGGIDHYEWRLDGGKWEKTKKIEQPLGPLGAGQHVFEVVAVDAEGAKSEPLSHGFTVTNTAPTLVWESPPAEDETFRAPPAQTLGVKGTDADGKIAAYRFSLDTPRQPTDQAEATFKIEGLAEGPHTLYAWAVDDAGAVSERLERRFRFMTNTAPTVSITGPASDVPWRERHGVVFGVTCDDAQDGLDGVELAYQIGDGAWQAFSGTQVKVDFDESGEKRVQVRARDREGLESKIATQTIRIRGDNPPTVSARLEPEEILVGERSQLTVAGSDADGGEVEVSYKVADKAWQALEGGRLSLDGTQEGRFTVQVRARDEDGREVTQSLTLVVKALTKDFTVDLGEGVKLEMVWIEGGSFMMGSPVSEEGRDDAEGPVHEVELDGFWMGKYEVTQGQYEAVMGSNPSRFKGLNNPVETVSWNDAVMFCKKLSQKTGGQYALPSEAQWEYACRAGSRSRFCFGDSDSGLGDYGWYMDNSGKKTHAVGGKKLNAWGLHDMHGNVWEWCGDWYGGYVSGRQTGRQRNPTGPSTGGNRVLRGGSWDDDPRNCRSAFRIFFTPDLTYLNFGFRVVCVARSQ